MRMELLIEPHTSQPVIETSRLVLSAFTLADVPSIFAYASNPAVASTTTWPAHKANEDSAQYLNWIADSTSYKLGELFYVWAIRRREDMVAIGSIDFKQPYPHSGQFDYALKFEEWNKGYVTEAARAVMSWAYSSVAGLQRFQSSCLADNIGSRRVMEKCGLLFEGVRLKSVVIKGKIVDTAHYALVI